MLAVGLIAWQLATQWWLAHKTITPMARSGRTVSIGRPDLLAESEHFTLVAVTASYCHFCRDSLPFYRSLFPVLHKAGVRIVGVTPEDPEINRKYLSSNGLPVDAVYSASSVGMEFGGTPTLALLAQDGGLIDAWVGRLSDQDQAKVVRRVSEVGPGSRGRAK